MLDIIWPLFIIISIVFSFTNNSVDVVNSGIFTTLKSATDTTISMLGAMCFWNGMIYVIKDTVFFDRLINRFGKVIEKIFKGISKNSEIGKKISINMISNLFGIGNAATVSGIEAITIMENENKSSKYMSKNMMIFILLNTASIQIIPTTIIAIRASMGSKNPGRIIIGIWFVSLIVFLFELMVGKIFFKEGKDYE